MTRCCATLEQRFFFFYLFRLCVVFLPFLAKLIFIYAVVDKNKSSPFFFTHTIVSLCLIALYSCLTLTKHIFRFVLLSVISWWCWFRYIYFGYLFMPCIILRFEGPLVLMYDCFGRRHTHIWDILSLIFTYDIVYPKEIIFHRWTHKWSQLAYKTTHTHITRTYTKHTQKYIHKYVHTHINTIHSPFAIRYYTLI